VCVCVCASRPIVVRWTVRMNELDCGLCVCLRGPHVQSVAVSVVVVH